MKLSLLFAIAAHKSGTIYWSQYAKDCFQKCNYDRLVDKYFKVQNEKN